MAYEKFALCLLITIAAPASANQPAPAHDTGAPPAPADARYCLRVDPPTGSRMETIRCETREDWSLLDVDVDQEWADNGVRVIVARPMNS
jgi:hypothetical protein